ncbi:MAG: type II secretion system protein [Phycisphaerae bacterium]
MRSYIVKKRGFTLIELLVVISIIALLIAILLPSLARAKELANRAVCSANIRGIIQSCYIYAQSNNSQFPATMSAPTGSLAITAGGAPGGPNTTPASPQTAGAVTSAWYTGTATASDPLSCLWMLVLQGQDTPKSFICPSDPIATTPSLEYQTTTSTSAQYYFNFDNNLATAANTNGQGESYSIACPWNDSGGVGGWWTDNSGSDVPEVSDMAPASPGSVTTSGSTLQRNTAQPVTGNTYGNYIYNSGNHNGDGQNVGFGDDHVSWEVNPYVGQSGDNIFTFQSAAADGPGTSGYNGGQSQVTSSTTAVSMLFNTPPYDICMLPARDVSSGQW